MERLLQAKGEQASNKVKPPKNNQDQRTADHEKPSFAAGRQTANQSAETTDHRACGAAKNAGLPVGPPCLGGPAGVPAAGFSELDQLHISQHDA